jgi:1-acyl-sn-glycerol-3-phosphate acyltransferase
VFGVPGFQASAGPYTPGARLHRLRPPRSPVTLAHDSVLALRLGPRYDLVTMRPWYRFCRFLCQWFGVLFFLIRVKGVRDVPDEGGVLLISNHQSFFDPVLATLVLHREGNYMARDSLFANPLFRWLIRSLNAFPVRRQTADVSAIKEMMRRLKDGKVVAAFPEGTRTPDGTIGRFLPGVPAVAVKARATIVPVLIDGAFQSWPRHRLLPRPAQVRVVYGRPIPPEQLRGRDPEELAEQVRQQLIRMQRELSPAPAVRWPEKRLADRL